MRSTTFPWLFTFALAVGGCSVVTGLNKDYTFDDEAGAGDAGKGDGASADGAGGDGGAGTDGGGDGGGTGEGATCTGETPCTNSLICCGGATDPSLTCGTQKTCQSKKIQLDCVRSNDCGARACCLQQGSNGALTASCLATCPDKELCDLNDPKCRQGKKCTASDVGGLATGFGICN